MTDYLLNPTGLRDSDDTKAKNSEIPRSIVNSVTNDEDDWADSKHNSGRSILRSVTNDDDDSIEPKDECQCVAMPVQQYPLNHPSEFSSNGTKSTELPQPTMPMFSQVPSESNVFENEFFLIRYEHMMMDQEKEERSASSHLQFFLKLLLDLKADTKGDGSACHQVGDEASQDCYLVEFALEDLKEAYGKLKNSPKYDVVKTDKQFLMVLDILCDDKYDHTDITISETDRKISWAEIVQCYRNCVTGMQTLEKIGADTTIRNRAKERTLALLSGYRKSSFTNSSTDTFRAKSIRCSEKKLYDGESACEVSRVNPNGHSERKSNGLLNHPFVSFFAGAIIGAMLVLGQSSYSKQMMQSTCSPVVNESLHSSVESIEEPMGEPQHSRMTNQAGDSIGFTRSKALDSSAVVASDTALIYHGSW